MRTLAPVTLLTLCCSAAACAADFEQTWQLRRSRWTSDEKVHFTLERSRAGNHWKNSSDVPLDRFRNLSLSALERGGDARFEYVHDAGSIICTGRFSWGSGSGQWTFKPNPSYVSELQRLGYAGLYDEQILSLFLHNVTLDYARGMRDAGLQPSLDDLRSLRVHGVQVDFVRALRTNGFSYPARDIVQLRIHGVTAELMEELKGAGYGDIFASDAVQLRIHGVSPQYVRELRSSGLRPPAKDVVQLRIHGVPIEFMHTARDLGYQFTIRELIDLRTHGVDGGYLRKLRDAGMKNLTASQIQRLRIHGVF